MSNQKTKPECLFVIVARDVSSDVRDNMLSLHKIIEQFNFGAEKTEIARLEAEEKRAILFPAEYRIATSWYLGHKLKDNTKAVVKISIVDPNGVELDGPGQDNELPAGIERINVNFEVKGFPFTMDGVYRVVAKLSLLDYEVQGSTIVKAFLKTET